MYKIEEAIDDVVDQQRRDVVAGGRLVANWYQFTQSALREYCHLLSALASSSHYATGLPILEVGTEYGLSTLAMAHGLQCSPVPLVHTWELDAARWSMTQTRFNRLGAQKVIASHVGRLDVSSLKPASYAMVYVDGDHSYLGCLKDLNDVCGAIHPRGVILCHDSLWEDHPDWNPERNGVRQAIAMFLNNRSEWMAMQLDGFALLQRKQPFDQPSLQEHPNGVRRPGRYKFDASNFQRLLVRPGASSGPVEVVAQSL
jgi:predicted O-methyltransferase YrrM